MTLLLGFVVVAATVAGQLLLKRGATPGGYWLNAWVLAGYGVFLVAVAASYALMQRIPLMYFTVVMSLNYLGVGVAAWLLLGERFGWRRWLGTLLVVAGVVVFSLGVQAG